MAQKLSVQLQCYSHRRRTLHASYNTQLFSCQQVNAVQLLSVRVWVSHGKSGSTWRLSGNVGWSEMERLRHINAHAGFLFFYMYIFFPSFCSVRWNQLPTLSGLKTLWFGISFKPWTCFVFATPATCIPPYCLAVFMPLPRACETVCVW